jgi:hypothetical protein
MGHPLKNVDAFTDYRIARVALEHPTLPPLFQIPSSGHPDPPISAPGLHLWVSVITSNSLFLSPITFLGEHTLIDQFIVESETAIPS